MAAITSAEILIRRTIKTGSAGGSLAQATADASLGKYASTTDLPASGANTMFDDISGAENAANTVDYRGYVAHNTNAANALQNAVVWISAETAGGSSIAIATDNVASSVYTSASAQLAEIATETTAPTPVSAFSSPTTVGTGLSLGSIAVNFVKGFWLRRTAANTAAQADGVTIAVGGDTGAL
jgi:hypothetical protein